MEISLSLKSNHILFNGILYPHMENMIVVPSVLIAWVKSIGIHDKKRNDKKVNRLDMKGT